MTSVSMVVTTPKSIFFQYDDPPTWISESRMFSILGQIRDKTVTVESVLKALCKEGIEKAQEFVSRCISLKNSIYYANEAVYTNAAVYTKFDNELLRNILRDVVKFQQRSRMEVFPRTSVLRLLQAESNLENEADSLAFTKDILEPGAWSADALCELARRADTLEVNLTPPIRYELHRLHQDAFRTLWPAVLRDLVTDPILEGHNLNYIVVGLDTDFMADSDLYQELVQAAREHRSDEGWVTNFRGLMNAWLKTGRGVSSDKFRITWNAAVEAGLLSAIDQAINLLDLRPEARMAFTRDLEELEQMTGLLQSSPGTEEGDTQNTGG